MKKIFLILLLSTGILYTFDLFSDNVIESPKAFSEKRQSRLDESTFWEKETSEKEILSKDTEGLLNAPPPETGDGQKLTGDEGTPPPPPLPLETGTTGLLFFLLLSIGYLMIRTKHVPFRKKGE